MHEQLKVIAATRPDVSLSARHFPFCTDCNDFVPGTRHPSACKAALAAEAAGLVAGAEGFWLAHDWLFRQKGQFTDEELREFVTGHGWSHDEFVAAMNSEEALEAIRGDTRLAHEVGLKYTPMTFLNGRLLEFRGETQRVPPPTGE